MRVANLFQCPDTWKFWTNQRISPNNSIQYRILSTQSNDLTFHLVLKHAVRLIDIFIKVGYDLMPLFYAREIIAKEQH